MSSTVEAHSPTARLRYNGLTMDTRTKGAARRVVVGLSGGVDSAVAAAQLQAQGYDVIGVTLETWHAPEPAGQADPEEAPARVQAVADHLHIPLIRHDVRQAFYERIVAPFVDAYAAGRTPNPCTLCNPTLKFATLIEEADAHDARWVATGHYARVLTSEGDREQARHLLMARARAKDQSYALYRLTQRQLRRLLLPLGDVESKDEVRDIARTLGLPSAETGDSQDLCFVASAGYPDVLASLRPEALRPGPIYDEAGTEIGQHRGLALYTVGQRSGLGIAASERLYVLELDPEHNALIVGPRSGLARRECVVTDLTFTMGSPPATPFTALGRIRYRAPLVPITVSVDSDDRAHVTFDGPQFGVAPGQSLVFYSGEEVLGGGVIV